ncbi:hypothetical protein FB451DRAFT_1071521 [Mycena latifolia]|nr:hypothetical protein FB451DRAFT_1071521 [Mycena latifolia]
MRQKTQTPLDAKLRTALENMRYAACTDEDIAFLNSRVASDRPGFPHLDSAKYRNVSVITAFNIHKDTMNELGARRFAEDTGQELAKFFSADKLSTRAVDRKKWSGCEQARFRNMGPNLQKALWAAPPSTTNEHIAGCLHLCVGMPVLIKSNEATELCMTKGQEAVVVGWDSAVGPSGQKILDALFVELVNPPRKVLIPGLPLNVVPLGRTSTHVTALLQDDSLLSLMREQVLCLPNFAMTDYASQGKFREVNVVHLNNCKDHRSYYVALSRGFTAENTVIVQAFDDSDKKIRSGLNGYLRQEFRELELLDELTRLRFEDVLPRSVTGLYRGQLLKTYKAWKGRYMQESEHFHEAIKFNASKDSDEHAQIYGEWRPTIKEPRKAAPKKKRKAEDEPPQLAKKQKLEPPTPGRSIIPNPTRNTESPLGLIWDSTNYSCGYDAFFTPLRAIWADDPSRRSIQFTACSLLLGLWALATGGTPDRPEEARDAVRRLLHLQNPADFPIGPNGIRLDSLFTSMTSRETYASAITACPTCRHGQEGLTVTLTQYVEVNHSTTLTRTFPDGIGLQEWFDYSFSRNAARCPACRYAGRETRMQRVTTIADVPPIIILIVGIGMENLRVSELLRFRKDNTVIHLRLRGLLYHSRAVRAGHFTSIAIKMDGAMWYHDGITTRRSCRPMGNIRDLADTRSLERINGEVLCAAIYAQD